MIVRKCDETKIDPGFIFHTVFFLQYQILKVRVYNLNRKPSSRYCKRPQTENKKIQRSSYILGNSLYWGHHHFTKRMRKHIIDTGSYRYTIFLRNYKLE